MPVVEDQGLLDELVVSLELVDVVLVVDDVVLVLLQLIHLVLQGRCDLDGAPGNLLMQSTGGDTGEWGSARPLCSGREASSSQCCFTISDEVRNRKAPQNRTTLVLVHLANEGKNQLGSRTTKQEE